MSGDREITGVSDLWDAWEAAVATPSRTNEVTQYTKAGRRALVAGAQSYQCLWPTEYQFRIIPGDGEKIVVGGKVIWDRSAGEGVNDGPLHGWK